MEAEVNFLCDHMIASFFFINEKHPMQPLVIWLTLLNQIIHLGEILDQKNSRVEFLFIFES